MIQARATPCQAIHIISHCPHRQVTMKMIRVCVFSFGAELTDSRRCYSLLPLLSSPFFPSSSPPSFSSVTPPSPQCSSASTLPVSSLPPPPPPHPLEVSVITEDPVTVICSATTMRPLYKPTALNNKNQDLRDSNIAVCGETSSSLSCEEEFKQAEEIFKLLYPDLPFLPLRDEEVDHPDPMDEI